MYDASKTIRENQRESEPLFFSRRAVIVWISAEPPSKSRQAKPASTSEEEMP